MHYHLFHKLIIVLTIVINTTASDNYFEKEWWDILPKDRADERRTGYFLNVGAGFNFEKIGSNDVQMLSNDGYVGAFQVGLGINEDVLIYYTQQINSERQLFNEKGQTSYVGLGCSYFVWSEIYLKLSAGVSTKKESDSSELTGRALLMGVGYEFTNTISLEFNYMTVDWYAKSLRYGSSDITGKLPKSLKYSLLIVYTIY